MKRRQGREYALSKTDFSVNLGLILCYCNEVEKENESRPFIR